MSDAEVIAMQAQQLAVARHELQLAREREAALEKERDEARANGVRLDFANAYLERESGMRKEQCDDLARDNERLRAALVKAAPEAAIILEDAQRIGCPYCEERNKPKPLTDEAAYAQMVAWLRGGDRQVKLNHHPFKNRYEVIAGDYATSQHADAEAPSIAEAWTALQAQPGFPK